jgi:hypothetical protein
VSRAGHGAQRSIVTTQSSFKQNSEGSIGRRRVCARKRGRLRGNFVREHVPPGSSAWVELLECSAQPQCFVLAPWRPSCPAVARPRTRFTHFQPPYLPSNAIHHILFGRKQRFREMLASSAMCSPSPLDGQLLPERGLPHLQFRSLKMSQALLRQGSRTISERNPRWHRMEPVMTAQSMKCMLAIAMGNTASTAGLVKNNRKAPRRHRHEPSAWKMATTACAFLTSSHRMAWSSLLTGGFDASYRDPTHFRHGSWYSPLMILPPCQKC